MAVEAAGLAITALTTIAGGVESTVSFINANNPTAAGGNSVVRIAAGQEGPDGACFSCGGNLPKLFAKDIAGNLIGRYYRGPVGSSGIQPGSLADLTVDQNHFNAGGKQPVTLTIQADGVDALCMAYVTHTWPDGTVKAWLGDMAYACDWPWAYSNIFVQTTDGQQYKPKCGWIDGDRTNGLNKGITARMSDFGGASSGNSFVPTSGQGLCAPPHSWFFNYEFDNDGNVITPTKRSRVEYKKRHFRTFDGKIIASSDPSHSAKALCESAMSWSPDFVSFADGLFCDMSSKKLWPLCSAETVKNCFDWVSKTLIGGGSWKRATTYTNVTVWE